MSYTKYKKAQKSIITVIERTTYDKSSYTQTSMRHRLMKSLDDLYSLDFKISNINKIQPKHIDALVTYWIANGLAAGSIKNRMSDFRKIADNLRKHKLVENSNSYYGIQNRKYVSIKNRAIYDIDLDKFKDKYIRTSIELQKEFGLTKKEALNIVPKKAFSEAIEGIDLSSYLYIDESWTKNRTRRRIEIRNESQIKSIKNAISIVGNKSLIPRGKTYIQQRRIYDKAVKEQGYSSLNGLRHAYAQKRYKEETGWECPFNGGIAKSELTKEQKIIDKKARSWISRELKISEVTLAKDYIG